MTPRTAAQALSDAASALTQEYDVTDVLVRLIRDCAEILQADAIGLLVLTEHGQLELLSSTSHHVSELETFQIQQDSGPCVDAIRSSTTIAISGKEPITGRWPSVGPAIIDAGYQSVTAHPMRWRGSTLGAMNIFHTAMRTAAHEELMLGQAFADVATLVIVQDASVPTEQITLRIHGALNARTAIERAKGVLAYQHKIDMAAAYDRLVHTAGSKRISLTDAAADVLDRAQQRAKRDGS
jgi:hypothetical protein